MLYDLVWQQRRAAAGHCFAYHKVLLIRVLWITVYLFVFNEHHE